MEDLYRGSGSGPIYSIHVDEKKENVMFLCKTHLNIIALSEMRYYCTSQTSKDFYFDSIKKRFCVQCIRHFCHKFTFFISAHWF